MKAFSLFSKSILFLLTIFSGLAIMSCPSSTSTVTKYTITYDINGGTGKTPIDTKTYSEGDTATILDKTADLNKQGFSFIGWARDANATSAEYAPGSTYKVAKINLKLFAIWSQLSTYKINYDLNGGLGTAPFDNNAYLEGSNATVLDKTASMTKVGFDFIGWSTTPTSTTPDYIPGSTYIVTNINTTLYAVWTNAPTYTITYDLNGGTGTPPVDTNSYLTGSNATVLDKNSSMTKAGFGFIGWAITTNATNADYIVGNTLVIAAANIILYAIWTDTFYVYYTSGFAGANYPGILPATQSGKYGAKINVDTTYSSMTYTSGAESYTIYGWLDPKTHKSYGKNNSQITLGTENITLEADVGSSGLNFTNSVDPGDIMTVSKGACMAIDVKVPNGIDGANVTTIYQNTWQQNTTVNSISLPYWLRRIKPFALAEMSNLKTIQFENINSLDTIETAGFWRSTALTGNSTTSGVFKIGKGIKYIGPNAFDGATSIKEIIFDDAPTVNSLYIERNAFNNLNITSLELPKHTTNIANDMLPHSINFTTLKIVNIIPPSLASNFVSFGNTTATIYVPSASLNAYKTAWGAKVVNPIVGY